VLRLIKPATVSVDTRLQGPTLRVEDLLRLEEGDVLTFDYPVSKPVDTLINGKLKLLGQVVNSGSKMAFLVHKYYHSSD
jgi:flagellar motor switch protein FliM